MAMRISAALALAACLIAGSPAMAQQPQPQDPQAQPTTMRPAGAQAGNSVVPSTHSAGCGGLLCDSDDPRRVANVPPPPCQGLLCSLSPYSMAPPVTASDTARAPNEPPRAEAAPAAAPEAKKKRRKARARTAAPAVAARTPAPAQ